MTEETFESALWAIRAVAKGLAATGGEGVGEVLERLSAQSLAAESFIAPRPLTLPACRHLAPAVAEAAMLNGGLAAAIAAIDGDLRWQQSEGYSDALLGEGFMANYAHCDLIGPDGFFPGDDFQLGLFLLGPDRHYRDHYHPAPELYWTLTGPSDWRHGQGRFTTREAGETIWHRPNLVHATVTHATPLLAVWCWTNDTAMPPKLCGA